jgi:hypothetical protein
VYAASTTVEADAATRVVMAAIAASREAGSLGARAT